MNMEPFVDNLDYAAGALALLLHFIAKGFLDDGKFFEAISNNRKYIVTASIATAIGLLGADTLGPTMGFASGFTFCVTWGGAAGSLLYNMFKFTEAVKPAGDA